MTPLPSIISGPFGNAYKRTNRQTALDLFLGVFFNDQIFVQNQLSHPTLSSSPPPQLKLFQANTVMGRNL